MPKITVLVTADPAASSFEILQRLPSDARVIISKDLAELRRLAPEADVILADFREPKALAETFRFAARVRWLHSLSAGVDKLLTPEMIASPVQITNGRGVFRRPLGEWVVAAMLHFSYEHDRLLRNQEAERWEPFEHGELHGKTLGIVGYGEIGRAAAERARPFGMHVLALRRNTGLSANDPLLDATFAPADINKMLAECDYVAAAAPLTPETRAMIGAAQLAAMKSSAVIINVGRGPVIDEGALIHALQEGKIRGAALDVFETEPLPKGHPFYRLKNLLLSPHCADHTPGWLDRAFECFLENFERFSKGEPLRNVVDKHAGY